MGPSNSRAAVTAPLNCIFPCLLANRASIRSAQAEFPSTALDASVGGSRLSSLSSPAECAHTLCFLIIDESNCGVTKCATTRRHGTVFSNWNEKFGECFDCDDDDDDDVLCLSPLPYLRNQYSQSLPTPHHPTRCTFQLRRAYRRSPPPKSAGRRHNSCKFVVRS